MLGIHVVDTIAGNHVLPSVTLLSLAFQQPNGGKEKKYRKTNLLIEVFPTWLYKIITKLTFIF